MHLYKTETVSLWINVPCFSRFSKKITDKRRIALKKPSANNNNNSNSSRSSSDSIANIEPHSNGHIEPVPNYSVEKNPFDFCSICRIPLDTVTDDNNDSESKIENIVFCRLCLSQICKSPQCGVFLAKHNHWECSNCHHFDSVVYVRAYDWIFEQLNRRFDDKATIGARVTKTTPLNDTNPNSAANDVMLELNGNFYFILLLLLFCCWLSIKKISYFNFFFRTYEKPNTPHFFWTISINFFVLVFCFYIYLNLNIQSSAHADESSPIPLQQRVRIREFIEDLLASMLGGSLDHVCVGQIYKNLECKSTFF